MDGRQTEANWAIIHGLTGTGYNYGTLCEGCATEIVEARAEQLKNKEAQILEDRQEKARLNEQNQDLAQEKALRRASRKGSPVHQEAISGGSPEPKGVKPPKDLRGLKLVSTNLRADFKGGSIRQLAYQQALANPAELNERLHHDARWLVQRGYLAVAGENQQLKKEVPDADPDQGAAPTGA